MTTGAHGGGVRRGFTLLELLVVIGVIAVLLGLLFPALGRAREAARTSVCLSNVRQITNAAIMYTSDHENTWPVIPYRETATSAIWTSWTWGGATTSDYWPTAWGWLEAKRRPLNAYLYPDLVLEDRADGRVELPVFECPSDQGTYQRSFWNTSTQADPRVTCYEDIGTSYHLNVKWWYASARAGETTAQRWQRTRHMFRSAEWRQPASFVWLHDQTMDFVSHMGVTRHGDHGRENRATAAFMDGHCDHIEVVPGEAVTDSYNLLLQ